MEIVEDDASERALALIKEILERANPGQILLTRSACDLARQGSVAGGANEEIQWLRQGTLPQIGPSRDLEPEVEIFAVAPAGMDPEGLNLGEAAQDMTPARSRRAADIDEDEMIEALRLHAFNLQAAADSLGISRSSLYKLVEKSPRVRKASDLSAEEIERCRDEHGHRLDLMAERLEVSRRALRRRMTELGLD